MGFGILPGSGYILSVGFWHWGQLVSGGGIQLCLDQGRSLP